MDRATIQPGAHLVWDYTPRGGYGFSYPVRAEVLKIGPKRVQVRVQRASGRMVEIWVEPKNLRERSKR